MLLSKKKKDTLASFSLETVATVANHTFSLLNFGLLKILFLPDIIKQPQKIRQLLLPIESSSIQTLNRQLYVSGFFPFFVVPTFRCGIKPH